MSQYQLLLSQKVTSLCPIISLVMTQISTSPVPKKHIVMFHNSSQRDSKSTSPVPKNHLVQSQNSSRYDHKSTTTSQHSSSNFLVEKKRFLNKNFYVQETVEIVPDNPLKTQSHKLPSITLKSSVMMMEMFSLLNKYPTLCKLKSLRPF